MNSTNVIVALDLPRDDETAQMYATRGRVFWLQTASDVVCAAHPAGIRAATALCFWSDFWVDAAAAYLRKSGHGDLEPELRRKAHVTGALWLDQTEGLFHVVEGQTRRR